MKNKKIAVIGGGNIGLALVNGLLKTDIQPKNITVTRRKITELKKTLGHIVNVSNDNIEAIQDADFIILAVKPFGIDEVLKQIQKKINNNQIIISLVTNVSISHIENSLKNRKVSVFRAMPNTAMDLRESVTCITGKSLQGQNIEEVESFFNLIGKTIRIREEYMGAATVLGACGIAFALRFLRAFTQGGVEIGFSANTAQYIAAQTLKGASELVLTKHEHPESEIDKVTTPRGITISGLNEMEFNGFSSSLIKGILTSFKKIEN